MGLRACLRGFAYGYICARNARGRYTRKQRRTRNAFLGFPADHNILEYACQFSAIILVFCTEFLTPPVACVILHVRKRTGIGMDDVADDAFSSQEPRLVKDEAEDAGREIAVDAGGNSSGGSLLLDSKSNGAPNTSEWDSYVDTQIHKGWPDLTFEEQGFCDEYLENGYKHREAAVVVGRSPSAGIRLVNKPLCREYIMYYENKRRQRRIVSERFFDAQLTELYDMALGEIEVPIVTGSGEELTARKFNGPLALAVLQERAKISGVSKPDETEVGGVNVIIDVGALVGHKTKEVN